MKFRRLGPILAIAVALSGALAAQQAPTTIETLLSAARAAYAKGDYAGARAALEQAWGLAEQTPPEEPKRYEVLKQQYAVAFAIGQFTEAEKYLQLAINWRENTLGRDNPKVAEDLTELAMLCRNLQDVPRGLDILAIVNSIYSRTLGTQSTPVADTYSRIALLEMVNLKPERAASALRVAIVLRENLLGTEHVGLLPELLRLGTIWIVLRDYEKAEQVYRHALIIHERAFGPGNPDLIPTVEGLAYALFGQKKYSDAEPYYLRLISLWEAAGGKDNPMLAITLDKLSVFYREQDRRDESDAALVRSNAIRALFYATGLSEKALLELNRDREEAERLYRRAAAALDPLRAEHKELLSQIEANLKLLEVTLPKPAPALPTKKANPKSNRKV